MFLVIAICSTACSTVPKYTGPNPSSLVNVKAGLSGSEQSNNAGHLIRPGDTLKIFVYSHAELSQKILVPPSGKITYPFLGTLKVGDKTIFDVKETIQEGLSKGFIPSPQVSVNIEKLRGKKIYVLGEVGNPQVSLVTDEIDAIEAITSSGGFTKDANPSAVLLIRKIGNNRRRMDALNLQSFLKAGDFGQNPTLEEGDILYVPPSVIANVEKFFMRLNNIFAPMVYHVMQGIIIGPSVKNVLKGRPAGGGGGVSEGR